MRSRPLPHLARLTHLHLTIVNVVPHTGSCGPSPPVVPRRLADGEGLHDKEVLD